MRKTKLITSLFGVQGIAFAYTIMIAEIVSLVLLLFILNKFYDFVFSKPPGNAPPVLPRLPIWGSYWFLLWGSYRFPHRTIQYYTKKYKSKVVGCWLGNYYTVVAANYQSVKELLTNKNFDGRLGEAYALKARAFGKKLGVFFNDGSAWKEQKRFALRNMRDFGFGRRMDKVENDFAEELNILLDTLKNGPINDEERNLMKDGKVSFPEILYPIAANFFLTIFTGERVPRTGHRDLREVAKASEKLLRNTDTTGGAILITPWLRHFVHGFGFQGFMQGAEEVKNFIKKCFETHKASYIEEAERGFLDTYIKRMKENEEESSTFSEEQLLILGSDLILPATTANPWAITGFIKHMMHYPHIMQNVQKEIDTVVGRDRLITLNDRVNLPYTDATIREIMRFDSMNPWSVAHRAIEDDKLCGYDIPANTVVVSDLHSMHHDSEFWGDPENLRPERFLTEDGRLGKDHTLPFGAGGRLCAGETFARQFLFLVFSTLVQNFDFSFVDGEPNSLEDKLQGLTISPKDLRIKVTPRE